ncbi:MAG TPA: helix-turn-helix transcriptional regulator [Candidatus Saccharimonadales bacterium]|nr:helix-turn-helix transcriptional regulator [Candidatus Saccharimonadales bacterium]
MNEASNLENLKLVNWLEKTRQRLKVSQSEFYENIGVKQQTGGNYESGKTPVPTWVVIRAVRKYGDREDLHWWLDLTLPS